MSVATWITGDARAVMATLEPGSVDLVVTSPPFLALRSYLPEGDPAKAFEMGAEANPGEFVDALLDVTEAAARLLASHGSLVVELGDTYSGSGGAGGDYAEGGIRENQPKFRAGTPRWDGRPDGQVRTTDSDPVAYPTRGRDGWPMAKSLALIPESYRWALVYGRNPFTGRPTDPWRARNVIRWVRPNPPVGALGDKFRPATSEMVVACKSATRWFDLDAVRLPLDPVTGRSPGVIPGGRRGGIPGGRLSSGDDAAFARGDRANSGSNPAGAPPLDWWSITGGGYPGSHYAVFPPELITRPVEAMCPRRVCRSCGIPSRRLVDAERLSVRPTYTPGRVAALAESGAYATHGETNRTTTGWSSCGCAGADGIRLDGFHTGTGWRPGLVLDPFGGSGTTAMVATGHGRDCVSIDLDARNLDLARERVGMWLEDRTPPPVVV